MAAVSQIPSDAKNRKLNMPSHTAAIRYTTRVNVFQYLKVSREAATKLKARRMVANLIALRLDPVVGFQKYSQVSNTNRCAASRID